jgi:hypothetical protein
VIRLKHLIREFLEKRFWFHITEQNWPNRIVLNPRSGGENWGSDEKGPSRISVSPTIEQCFAAVPYSDYNSNYNVYQTTKSIFANPADPNWVGDSHITEEHWLIEPTFFKKIFDVPLEDIKKFPILTHKDMHSKRQKEVIDYVKKYLHGEV